MKILRYILLIGFLFVLVSCGTEEMPEEHTFPDTEYAVNATDMAVVGDKIYYISDEKVYETASEAVVFEEFPVSPAESVQKHLNRHLAHLINSLICRQFHLIFVQKE